jgi:hypothetical protein
MKIKLFVKSFVALTVVTLLFLNVNLNSSKKANLFTSLKVEITSAFACNESSNSDVTCSYWECTYPNGQTVCRGNGTQNCISDC